MKSTHFIPFYVCKSTKALAMWFIHEIVRLHGVPTSIVPM